MDSAFDSCLKDTGSNPTKARHCVTTVGKLFTPTVPSGTEGRLIQLTPGIAYCSDSGQVVYRHWRRSTQPFIRSRGDNTFGSVRVSIRLSVGALLFEPFDL